MRRFFFANPQQLQPNTHVELADDIYHHWCKVLRAKVGDEGILFDGTGGEYQVTLTEIGKKSAQVQVTSFTPINRSLPYNVTIGLVMSRGERMDYAVQKATELGVSQIQLLTSQYGEVRLKPEQAAKKTEHWQQVAIAACEQCGLNIVPQMLPPMALNTWVNAQAQQIQVDKTDNVLSLVLAVPNQSDMVNATLQKIVAVMANADTDKASQPRFDLLIGPEGGLSEPEVELALSQGFLPWQIGDRVLRTETAPVVALAALQTIFALR